MPNLYAGLNDLRNTAPDGIRSTVTKYDSVLYRLCGEVSRWIDRECKRTFYPELRTRYFDGRGSPGLWVPDLISITSISCSDDDGETYTALTTDDYILTVAGDYNKPQSATYLVINRNSDTLSVWPCGQRSVKIVGVWGYSDDRDNAFEDSNDTVEDNPLTSSATTLTVNDIDGADLYGALYRIQSGQLLKIESEYVEAGLTVAATTINIVRGRNGSTAAAHVQNTAISIWRPPEPVKAACIIQTIRQMQRGFQGFGDARANPDLGQLFYFKQLDPEAAAKLAPYRILEIP